jgi:hypothetical protein
MTPPSFRSSPLLLGPVEASVLAFWGQLCHGRRGGATAPSPSSSVLESWSVDASGHLKAQEKMDLSYTPNLLTSILRSISETDSYEPDTRDGVIHRSRNILSCRVIACVSVHGWTMEKCRCTSSPTTLPDPSSAQWFTSTSAYILIDQGFVDNSEYKVYKQTVMCFPTAIAVWYLSPSRSGHHTLASANPEGV